jgi:predicted enzyme related to lactoylglutathione lyase
MIKQFSGASRWTEDINNLLPFYRDVLGLKVTMESPGYAIVGADSPDSPGLLLGTHSEVHGRNPDPKRHMVGFNSNDLQADWQRLMAAGVEFIEDPTGYGDGMWIATLKDPEGNLVQLFEFRPSA